MQPTQKRVWEPGKTMYARLAQRKASDAFSKLYKWKCETKQNQNLVELMNASTSLRFIN